MTSRQHKHPVDILRVEILTYTVLDFKRLSDCNLLPNQLIPLPLRIESMTFSTLVVRIRMDSVAKSTVALIVLSLVDSLRQLIYRNQ